MFRCYMCLHAVFSFRHSGKQIKAAGNATPLVPEDMYYALIDRETYGPVSTSTLQSWAASGRIHGHHMISRNNTHDWQKAETNIDLGLTWLVTPEGSDDSYLLSPTGVQALAGSALIPHDSTVWDKQTGQTLALEDALRTLGWRLYGQKEEKRTKPKR